MQKATFPLCSPQVGASGPQEAAAFLFSFTSLAGPHFSNTCHLCCLLLSRIHLRAARKGKLTKAFYRSRAQECEKQEVSVPVLKSLSTTCTAFCDPTRSPIPHSSRLLSCIAVSPVYSLWKWFGSQEHHTQITFWYNSLHLCLPVKKKSSLDCQRLKNWEVGGKPYPDFLT